MIAGVALLIALVVAFLGCLAISVAALAEVKAWMDWPEKMFLAAMALCGFGTMAVTVALSVPCVELLSQ